MQTESMEVSQTVRRIGREGRQRLLGSLELALVAVSPSGPSYDRFYRKSLVS